MPPETPRVGYVAKVFPRLSETFIVTELLAHERAGLDVEVFSLRPSQDRGAHADHGRLRAPVTELPSTTPTLGALLDEAAAAAELFDVWAMRQEARDQHPRELLQAMRLARLVHERGIGHLHAHFASLAATVTRLAAGLAGVPYSVTAHAKDIFHEDVRPEHLRRVLGDAAAVVTVSDFNVEHLRAVCPDLGDRLVRIHNGLELGRLAAAPHAPRAPRIVGVGRLVEKKGFADLIDACDVLVRAGHQFECRIVGGGVLADELEARVRGLGLQEVVTFTGPASQEVVHAEMAAAAVLAAPCVVGTDGNRDGLPTVLLEGMALGTPCVATPVTGIPEAVVDGETGLLVPERDPPALAAALARLLGDEPLRAGLARRARAHVEAHFDIDTNTAAWRAAALRTTSEEAGRAHRVRVR
jgi:colanic acid/amylovoran biosynthesis glycosyltransferase